VSGHMTAAAAAAAVTTGRSYLIVAQYIIIDRYPIEQYLYNNNSDTVTIISCPFRRGRGSYTTV